MDGAFMSPGRGFMSASTEFDRINKSSGCHASINNDFYIIRCFFISNIHNFYRIISAPFYFTLFVLFCAAIFNGPSSAQGLSATDLPPAARINDRNGVDLKTGELVLHGGLIAVGPAASPPISLDFLEFNSNLQNHTPLCGGMYFFRTDAVAVLGNKTVYFAKLINCGSSIGCNPDGNAIVSDGGAGYIITEANGTAWHLSPSSNGMFAAVSVLYPDGSRLDYGYAGNVVSGGVATNGPGGCIVGATSITSNYGYQIRLFGAFFGGLTPPGSQPSSVYLVNASTDYCSPTATSCPAFSRNWPSAVATLLSNGSSTIADALGRTTNFSNYTVTSSSPYIYSHTITSPTGVSEYISNKYIYYDFYNKPNLYKYVISSISKATGTWQYGYSINCDASIGSGSVTDPNGNAISVFSHFGCQDSDQSLTDKFTDELGRVTTYAYAGQEINSSDFNIPTDLNNISYPSALQHSYTYDGRGNVLSTTETPNSSTLSPISASATYVATCANAFTCNHPTATFDANGNETDYTYDPNTGLVLTKTLPAGANGVRPQTRYTYEQLSATYYNSSGVMSQGSPIWKLASTSTCQTKASCTGTSDEVKVTYTYDCQTVSTGTGCNLLPVSVTTAAGDGSLGKTVITAYDAIGNVTSVTQPMGSSNTPATTVYIWDAARQKIGELGPAPTGNGHYRAERITYDLDGRVTLDEKGYTTSQSDTTLSTFVSLEQHATVYDNVGRKVQESESSGGITATLTQYSYDALDRLICTAVRMNASAFASLSFSPMSAPSSNNACSLGPQGSDGPDRITYNTYDAAGHLLQVTSGYGTSVARNDKTLTYTADGLMQTEADGNGNLTTHVYDGFDRLSQTFYPNPSSGTSSSTTDYEQYGYDSNSNMLTDRRRDGNTLSMTYDALNREITKAGPGIPSIYLSYDLLGRKTDIAYNSTTGPGNAYSYDALGRVTSASTYSWPITFQYDLAGDRTAITWWDGVSAAYSYDTDGEMTSITPSAPNAPVSTLASYSYDDLGRRTGVSRGNGVSTAYGYDAISRLTSLTHTMVGSNVQSQAYGLGYTASSQIKTLSQSNGAYLLAASFGAPSFDGEFNSLSLWNGSTGVWATNYGWSGNPDSVAARTLPGTGEVELYVDPSLTGTGTTALGLNPYSESGGVLDLHAGPTPAADVSSIWGYKFTSGMISTRYTFTQTYGYFEAGMKLPSGQGNWPAFWLYAANANSELDVMEEHGGSNTITGTAHNNGSGTAATGVTNTIPNLTAGFHKFGVLWTPTTITWYVDGASIGSVPTPSNLNSPMYMIANLALDSSTPSNYAGGDLQIEYIHAYTLANSPVSASNQNLTYSVNGQNQLTTSGGAAISYDARGNLSNDSVNTYSFDVLNRLVSTGAGVTTVYDPEDRLLSLTQGATTTQFAYVGPDVATEINGSNQILRRYVPGPGEDEPVVWFEGSDGSHPRWLLQDHQGSVVAVTDMTGGAVAINAYSDYGSPGPGNLGRYQYTGQFYLPEVGVYDYKARLYSPTQARFMQTDPIGYKDGLNWYDYAHNDPVNGSDPTGLTDVAADCAKQATCNESVTQTVNLVHQSKGHTVTDSTLSVAMNFSKSTDAKGNVSWNVTATVSNVSGKAFSSDQLSTMGTSIGHTQMAGIGAGLGSNTTQILTSLGAVETRLGTDAGSGFRAGSINPLALRGGRENGNLDHNIRGALGVWSYYQHRNGPDATDIYEGYSDGGANTMANWRGTYNSLGETTGP